MIKEAELQNAYMLGRQAAMEKLAQQMPYEQGILEQLAEKFQGPPAPAAPNMSMPGPDPIMSMPEAEKSFMGGLTPENLALFEAIAAEKAQNQTPNRPRELSLLDRIKDTARNLVASDRADSFMYSPTPEVSELIADAEIRNAEQDMYRNAVASTRANTFMANPTPEVSELVAQAESANSRGEPIPATGVGLDPRGLSAQGIVGLAKQQEFDQLNELQKQQAIARMIGLDPSMGSMAQNLSRAGILGGAAGGTALNPSLMGAGASLAGALGGGQIGGNIGRGINAALQEAGYGGMADKLIAAGGGLGGLAGGLGAGYATR